MNTMKSDAASLMVIERRYRPQVVRCLNCGRGRLCDIAAEKIDYHPPPNKPHCIVKCPKCGVHTRLTFQ